VKKVGFILMAILAIVVGLLVGTLNAGPVQLDLLWVQFELPLGLAILLGFSLGLVTGLSMIYLVRVLPLRLQLRKARSASMKQDSPGKQNSHGINLPDD
jgi:uncharacterized integral membrane protein